MNDRRSKTAGSGNEAAARRERLAASLRDNLRKRKSQARSRSGDGDGGGGGGDAAGAPPDDETPAASNADDGAAPAGADGTRAHRRG